MSWDDQVDEFAATLAAVAGIVDGIEDPSAPGLGVWDIHSLAAHTLRAVTTLQRYVDAPPDGGATLPGAAAYLAAYLEARETDPGAMDAAVASRSRSDADGMSPSNLRAAYAAAQRWVDDGLSRCAADHLVPTRFGNLKLNEYLRTRSLELVVHGLDLASATGTSFAVPRPALMDAVVLVVEVAAARGQGGDLLRLLTGRPTTEPVLPVLR